MSNESADVIGWSEPSENWPCARQPVRRRRHISGRTRIGFLWGPWGNLLDQHSARRLSLPAIAHQPAYRHFLVGGSELTVIIRPILVRKSLP